MEFYLVVLYSTERSEARQWIVARQSTVVLQSGYQRQDGKEKNKKRDGLGERERYN